MTSVAEGYVELALRLGRHVDGLVDSYYGDAAIADRIDAEPLRPAERLVEDATELVARVDGEGLEEQRSRWLRAQVVGLDTVARKLAGEEVAYADEVERCYGVRPRRTPEPELERAHRELDDALPGSGPVAERYQAWREGDPVPHETLGQILEDISEDLRRRSAEVLGLPEGETYEIELVTDEPWAAYNHYEGGLRSRIAVNTDVTMATNFVTELMAHELYPGHHSEHSWKEQLLYKDRAQVEASILMIGTPESLIAEGIARLGLEILVEDEDGLAAEQLARHGIGYDADIARAVKAARRPVARVGGNAAQMLYEDGVSADEALGYLKRWGLMSDRRAKQALRFVMDPMWRSYVTTYEDGYALCRRWVAGDPARFKRLLTEQLTPADLVGSESASAG